MIAAVFFAALGAAMPERQAVAKPPDGTYTYALESGGKAVFTTTVVIAPPRAGTFVVSESATLPGGRRALVRTTYDVRTLLPQHYELHQQADGSNTDLTASVTTRAITFSGAPLSYQALPDTAYMIIGEGLNAYRVMLPFVSLANGNAPFTFVALNGNTTVAGKPIAATESRPAGVPSRDVAAAFSVGADVLTAWYDPKTFIPDEIDAFSGTTVKLVKYAPSLTALRAPARIVPLPLSPARYRERPVRLPSTQGAVLSGVLDVPANRRGPFPAFIFVHGSGPGTRDGGTQANPTFAALANALANNGVAVLRYDKRGIGKSTGTATEDWRVLSQDVRSVVAFARRQRGIDPRRIFLLGHSEGGFIVPEIANSLPVRGIVIAAGPAIPMEQILRKQGLASMPAARQKLFESAFGMYFGIDPAKTIAKVRCPMLLLQGSKDSQVLASDFPRLVRAARAAHRQVTAVLLRGDDHLFIRLPKTQAMEESEIFVPHRLDPRLPQAILRWLANL